MANRQVDILTYNGLVTECLPVIVDGHEGYSVHGDPKEGFYPSDQVRVLDSDEAREVAWEQHHRDIIGE